MNQQDISALVWSIAELLRGDFKQSEYGRVILPFVVLRRLDCVLEPTKEAALAAYHARKDGAAGYIEFVKRATKMDFFNTAETSLPALLGDPDHLKANLQSYVQGFSEDALDIFVRFDFMATIERLHKVKLLYPILERFARIDMHPDSVSNHQMGLLFEEILRRFMEMSNETAGEHYTPREVIRLMVELLFIEDSDGLTQSGVVRSIYDPTCGTGGMLSVAEDHLLQLNPRARLRYFGQELNDESYAICRADMIIKGQDVRNIAAGNTLSADGHQSERFDYMLSNPPFGVDWKKIERVVRDEHEQQGDNGRFGVGLARVSDGSLLFLMHMVSKMRAAKDGGSRIGIVLNGSPLFTGGAGSGESEIRRYLLENDLVEAIVAMPTDMFFNTGIATYVWILNNRKKKERRGYVQLIDASAFYQKLRKSMGSKRRELGPDAIAEIVKLYGDHRTVQQALVTDAEGKDLGRTVLFNDVPVPDAPPGGKVRLVPVSRIFRTSEFGYRTITIERPLKDEYDNEVLVSKGKRAGDRRPDASLRDTENVPLSENVFEYFEREVLPHAPDAWIDETKRDKRDGQVGIVGYEIPFNRHFYIYEPPRALEEIDADLKAVTDDILRMIGEMAA